MGTVKMPSLSRKAKEAIKTYVYTMKGRAYPYF